ncbi:SprT family zinc-dependent metalloprotease [Arhodomonas sp. KWT]|nr:SprT family zinc-dependent metalloprotease [Arhodomonas sp. KWT]
MRTAIIAPFHPGVTDIGKSMSMAAHAMSNASTSISRPMTPEEQLRNALTPEFFRGLGLGLDRCPVPTAIVFDENAKFSACAICEHWRKKRHRIVFNECRLRGMPDWRIRAIWLHEYAHTLLFRHHIDEPVLANERHLIGIDDRRGHCLRFACVNAALFVKWNGFEAFMYNFKFYDMSGAGGVNRAWTYGQALDFILSVATYVYRHKGRFDTPDRLCEYVFEEYDAFADARKKEARRRKRRRALLTALKLA